MFRIHQLHCCRRRRRNILKITILFVISVSVLYQKLIHMGKTLQWTDGDYGTRARERAS